MLINYFKNIKIYNNNNNNNNKLYRLFTIKLKNNFAFHAVIIVGIFFISTIKGIFLFLGDFKQVF